MERWYEEQKSIKRAAFDAKGAAFVSLAKERSFSFLFLRRFLAVDSIKTLGK